MCVEWDKFKIFLNITVFSFFKDLFLNRISKANMKLKILYLHI